MLKMTLAQKTGKMTGKYRTAANCAQSFFSTPTDGSAVRKKKFFCSVSAVLTLGLLHQTRRPPFKRSSGGGAVLLPVYYVEPYARGTGADGRVPRARHRA